jgi:hypothetical protein
VTAAPFMRPRFTGARFDGHAIPLEILGELAVFEEMIVEVAKWKFLQDHPDRKRSPRGFADGIDIKLTGVEDGSAIPVLSLFIATATLLPGDGELYFEKARDAITAAIHAAAHDRPVTTFLPEKALGYFDRIGRGLRDGEAIEFGLGNGQDTARLTKETRRKLLLASATVQELTEDVVLRGCIPEVDQADMTFEIQLLDGRKVTAPLAGQHLDTILEALTGYKSGTKVVLQGIGRYSRFEKLLGLDSVEHISVLDPLDVSSRLEELASLKDGWLEGKGLAPSREGLNWLSRTCESNLPEDLPFPYAYPTPEGGVQLEWELGDAEVSVDIDLTRHTAEWHALNLNTDKETSRSLSLNETADWQWILLQLGELKGGAT